VGNFDTTHAHQVIKNDFVHEISCRCNQQRGFFCRKISMNWKLASVNVFASCFGGKTAHVVHAGLRRVLKSLSSVSVKVDEVLQA